VRVSIFMSVFDVHINRTPIAGTVRSRLCVGQVPERDLDKASDENERQYFVVEGHDGRRVGFTQIAGLVARRILGFVKPGDIVAAGQRIGLIAVRQPRRRLPARGSRLPVALGPAQHCGRDGACPTRRGLRSSACRCDVGAWIASERPPAATA
jgi:phosphatidylserine decarboxylase precursor-related protein